MERLQRLKEWGCDVDGARERFLDDMDLYAACLAAVCEDPAIEKLGEALAAQDAGEAFEQAHTLKGVLLNLGADPLLAILIQIVEPLRKGSLENLTPRYEEFLAEREKLRLILEGELP